MTCFTIYFPKQAQPHGTQAGLPEGDVPPARASRLTPGAANPAQDHRQGMGRGCHLGDTGQPQHMPRGVAVGSFLCRTGGGGRSRWIFTAVSGVRTSQAQAGVRCTSPTGVRQVRKKDMLPKNAEPQSG